MRFNDRQQLYVLIGVFAVLLLGEATFAYFTWGARAEALDKLQTLDRQERAALEKRRQIPTLRENTKELASIIEEYVQILPSDEEVTYDAFLEDVDGFTRNTDLKIKKAIPVEIKQPKKLRNSKNKKAAVAVEKNFVQHRYRFELSGTFLGLLKFLNTVENHSRFLQVDRIEIKPQGSSNSDKIADTIALAENSVKDVVVEVSTYTYSKIDPEAKGAKK